MKNYWGSNIYLNNAIKKYGKDNFKRETLFVFNIAEFIDGMDRAIDAAFIPRILEELGLPHLGSSCETILNGLNKAKAKELAMASDVPTPDFFLVSEFRQDWIKQAEEIGYPVIIKPLSDVCCKS